MKESITMFDLEAAFKALDDIEIPVTGGIKANRPALTEIFSSKTKFDSLMEEYYDISSPAELDDAKEAREAEVAKAKLARIEKIVDLEADSPEDLLTSYVGKYIMQCPQCMTLFYKDQEDVVEAEDDPNTVNVNEVCQHCGNETGYTLVGKVGKAEAGEFTETEPELEMPEELPVEEPAEDETVDENTEELADLGDLEDLDLNLEDEETKTEESFTAHTGEALVEELADDKDLDAKLDAHNEYIEYLRAAIEQEEAALEKATNEQVKVAIQRNIDAFKADLEAALPDAVKNDTVLPDESVEDITTDEEVTEEEQIEDTIEVQEESCEASTGDALTEALHEETKEEISADEFEELIKSPEFKKPISDAESRAMLNTEKEAEDKSDKVEEANTIESNNTLEENIFTDINLTRAGKADWILKNAKKDYDKIKVADGKLVPDEKNDLFKTFIVIAFDSKNKAGKAITIAPSFNQVADLVPAKKPTAKTEYKEADRLAKGWSQLQNGGPAFIYLAKDVNDTDAVFLCSYFNGKLEDDQVDKYYSVVKKDLKARKKLAKAGGFDEEETTDADNSVEAATAETPTPEVSTESLDTIMAGLDELQESSLESHISDSLVEAYGNVAGFRLSECAYADGKLTIDGTIHFTSGNTRKTTYAFVESFNVTEGKINLVGTNEKLGNEKQFTLTGQVDNKTFITESFTRSK